MIRWIFKDTKIREESDVGKGWYTRILIGYFNPVS